VYLNLSHLSCDNSVFTVTPASMSLAPGDLAHVIVSFRPKSDGVQSATLSITSNDPDEPVATMLLRGTGRQPPHISVATAAVSASARPGEKATRTLSIVNSGESALNFELTPRNAGPRAPRGRKIFPREQNPAAVLHDGDASPAASARASYSGHREAVGASTRALRQAVQTTNVQGLKVLVIYTGEISEIVEALVHDPDLATLDFFDAEFNVPTLADLAPYDAVLETNDFVFKDAQAVGNALADYVDGGGSVIVTLASFIQGYDVRGRFASGGYLPFQIGSGPAARPRRVRRATSHHERRLFVVGDLLGSTTVPAARRWRAGTTTRSLPPRCMASGQNVMFSSAMAATGGRVFQP
jgi:hypothetical protein